MSKYQYRVYIIELAKGVLQKRKFRERNPQYIEGKPCVYVGSTGKPVEQRFQEHVTGVNPIPSLGSTVSSCVTWI